MMLIVGLFAVIILVGLFAGGTNALDHGHTASGVVQLAIGAVLLVALLVFAYMILRALLRGDIEID